MLVDNLWISRENGPVIVYLLTKRWVDLVDADRSLPDKVN